MLSQKWWGLLLAAGLALTIWSVVAWCGSYTRIVTLSYVGENRSRSIVVVHGKVMIESVDLDFLPGSSPVPLQLLIDRPPSKQVSSRWFQGRGIPGSTRYYISLGMSAFIGVAMTAGAFWLRGRRLSVR